MEQDLRYERHCKLPAVSFSTNKHLHERNITYHSLLCVIDVGGVEECYTHTDHLQFSRKAYYSFFEKIVHYGLLISKRLARDCFVQKNKNDSNS